MKKYSLRYKLRGILLPLFLITADQLTKLWAVRDLKGSGSRTLIEGVLGLSYVENRGMSFGLLQDQRFLFLAFTLLVCAFLIHAYLRIPETKRFRALSVCILFILAGALGNFIDRARQGYVVDFLELRFMSFPVFNIADCCITWTAVILALLLLFRYRDDDLKEIRLWKR